MNFYFKHSTVIDSRILLKSLLEFRLRDEFNYNIIFVSIKCLTCWTYFTIETIKHCRDRFGLKYYL